VCDVLEGRGDAYGGNFGGEPGLLLGRGRAERGGSADLVAGRVECGAVLRPHGLLRCWLGPLFGGNWLLWFGLEVLEGFVDETASCLGIGGVRGGEDGWVVELEVVE
jgi:hypothetical protein